jgi:hypothetical protein
VALDDSPIKAKSAFLQQFVDSPSEIQVAVIAEISLISRSPSRHGQIYAASWNDPIRWVTVGDAYGLYWIDGDPVEIVALIRLPTKLLI